MYKEYHDKHVLVTGQGPIYDIARQLGFRKVTTMKTLRHVFPSLDAVDHKRRRAAPWYAFILIALVSPQYSDENDKM